MVLAIRYHSHIGNPGLSQLNPQRLKRLLSRPLLQGLLKPHQEPGQSVDPRQDAQSRELPHLGQENNRLPVMVKDYASNVFVNCPFDDEYSPIRDAITFAIFDCGFVPRSALEEDDGGNTRFDKIKHLISISKFGVHDISRTELDEDKNLPRFNMPLELGVFTGISVLAARIRTLIHQCRVRTARFLHPRLFRSQLPSAAAALEGKPTGALAFRAFLRHRSTLVSFLRPGGLRCTRPRVSLPAPVAPRSSAAYRRTAAGSGALPPAGASSTAHASPTGPRFSPAAAGDS